MIVNRSSHAGGLIISNKPITDYNAMMRAPNGLLTTQFELHQAEAVGLVKFDLLSLSALDKIKMTMNLLIEHDYIKDQGGLRKTFNHYLNPDVINYDNKEMWDNISLYKSLFQYETNMGVRAIKMINPRNIHDLAVSNSIMRLKGEKGKESPMEKYIRYKNNIQEWYNDMDVFGLSENEIKILEKYLSQSYGVCESQEKLIKLTMDENVAKFDLRESDQARKAVAKGSKQAMKETEERLYNYGMDLGVRKIFTDYLWNVQFEMQKAYAFSEIHSYEYSIIALQEMNLNHFYPRVFWETSVLTIESESDENDENSSSTPYGKIATSICKLKSNGTTILSPDINNSNFGFKPLVEENAILLGLKVISGIGDEIVNEIIQDRPYATFKEFYNHFKNKENTKVTKSKIISLIKSGCFDFDNFNRIALMRWLACWETDLKTNLGLANLPKAIEYNINFNCKEELKVYKFKKFVLSKQYFYCQDPKFKSKKHYIIEQEYARPYFEKNFMEKLEEEKDYYYDNGELIVIDKSLEKVTNDKIEILKSELSSDKILKEFNKKAMQEIYYNMIENEDVNDWSLESISFYDREHSLSYANLDKYNVLDFLDLPEEPSFILKRRGKKEWRQYDLSRITGTIIDLDHNKYIASILTLSGVVNVRFYVSQYAHYKGNISELIDGKKKTIEKPWLARGNKIMVSGYRRGDEFVAKKYANSPFQHCVILIKDIDKEGNLKLQLERYNENEEN